MSQHIEFIQFDSFIIKKSEIIYAKKSGEDKIELIVKDGESTKTFTMEYNNYFKRDESFAKLTVDTTAFNLDFDWKHPLVTQIFYIRKYIMGNNIKIDELKKEVEGLRKELRKSRLLK